MIIKKLSINNLHIVYPKLYIISFTLHRINFDTIDNRLENLWVCEKHEGHNSIHASLLNMIQPLIKSGLLAFKEGKYYLNYEE